jgi:hypothetical protein
MAEPISLLNVTLVDVTSMGDITNRVNVMINLFRAVGGIFIAGAIITLWNIIQQKKQRKLLKEINQKLSKIENKLKR